MPLKLTQATKIEKTKSQSNQSIQTKKTMEKGCKSMKDYDKQSNGILISRLKKPSQNQQPNNIKQPQFLTPNFGETPQLQIFQTNQNIFKRFCRINKQKNHKYPKNYD